ncbi:MAG TPA: hypothetical protein VG871_18610 [Vicinamibacterales bacterium]|nr:hypothetical protein [Vicinamibacterales bacterium]
MAPVIGIDFDNTLVSYDALIHDAAIERGLIAAGGDRSKRSVRDRIRLQPDGEIEWQKLQALIYGPLMGRAALMPGADAFVRACRARGWPTYIVSHKTEFAGYDETGTNLRDAALAWMTAQGFFAESGLGFSRDQVFFESTRGGKIARIRALACTHFIDDLEEVFSEPAFPAGVEQFLFESWPPLHEHFFAARA